MLYLMISFNDTVTNGIVSFEQLSPVCFCLKKKCLGWSYVTVVLSLFSGLQGGLCCLQKSSLG